MVFFPGDEAVFHSQVLGVCGFPWSRCHRPPFTSTLWSSLKGVELPYSAGIMFPLWNMFLLLVTSPLRDTGALQLAVLLGL